jgi:endonuclease/exonuclease/phosphatase (EEP) superfamily protein YafD
MRRDLAAFADPVVVMGDLNMPSPRPAAITGYRSLAEHPTFPLEQPDRQLDHILLRGDFGVVLGSSAPELPLSDHRALVVDLAVGTG